LLKHRTFAFIGQLCKHTNRLQMETEDFRKFSFVTKQSPRKSRVAVYMSVVGIIFAYISTLLIAKDHDPLFAKSFVYFVFIYIVVPMAAGAIVGTTIKEFKVKWSLFTAFINEVLLGVILISSQLTSGINNLDALIIWSIFSFALWMLSIVGLSGSKKWSKNIALSMLQPALVFGLIPMSPHVLGEVFIGKASLAVLGSGILAVFLVFLLIEYLFSIVFSGVSAFAILSGFLKGVRGEYASIDFGKSTNAFLQYLKIVRGKAKTFLVAPWLHGGPIKGVGGGDLSRVLIGAMNEEYKDSYFMHVPCNHEVNPMTKDSTEKILKIIGADKNKTKPVRISRLIEETEKGITLAGQKINDIYLIFITIEGADDFDTSIFWGLQTKYDGKKIIFIDTHLNKPLETYGNVTIFSEETKTIIDMVDKVIKKLEKEPLDSAKIGTSLKEFSDGYYAYSMTLDAGSHKTVYVIFDTNGISSEVRELVLEAIKDHGIKEYVVMTTDTHSSSISAMIYGESMNREEIDRLIEESMENPEDAEISYANTRIPDVKILDFAYYELITITRILSRVIPLMFFVLFLFVILILWII